MGKVIAFPAGHLRSAARSTNGDPPSPLKDAHYWVGQRRVRLSPALRARIKEMAEEAAS